MFKYLARCYFSKFPVDRGKWRVWTKLLPYLASGRPSETECTLRDGLRFRLNTGDTIQRFVYYWGLWSPNECWLLRELLRPGDVFVDAGANFGYFTILASRLVGPTGQVIAFEPTPSTVRRLKRNLELNGASNVTLHECAITETPGTVRISAISALNSGANTILQMEQARESWDVPAVRLEDVIRAGQAIRVMKVDVEGAEVLLVRGFREHLEAGLVSFVICEVHDSLLRRQGSSAAEFFELMKSFGYAAYDFERQRLTELSELAPRSAEKRDQMNVLFSLAELPPALARAAPSFSSAG
jgi:FkbM family methyltransferase